MERVEPKEGYPKSLWLAVAGALFGAFQFGYQVGAEVQLCLRTDRVAG